MKRSFSYQQLEKILNQTGLIIYDLLTSKEIQNRYFNDRLYYLQAFEHINYVLAVFE